MTDANPICFSPSFRFEAKASAQGRLAGLASPFGGEPDAYGDVIAPGAFAASLATHKARKTAPAMLWAHDMARPVGAWDVLEERADGLHVEGQLTLSTTDGAEAFEHLRAGAVTGLSIGFMVASGGADYSKTGRILRAVNLAEISLVTIPAASAARVTSVKGAPLMLQSAADLHDLLREAGLAKGAADKIVKGGWPALTAKSPETDTLHRLADLLKAAARNL